MPPDTMTRVDSEFVTDFARVWETPSRNLMVTSNGHCGQLRARLDPDKVKNGLGQLVLALVKLLHELMERQAIRRAEAGSLTADQLERVGLTLMRQAEEIDRLRKEFGLEEEDLNLDLGPLGRLF